MSYLSRMVRITAVVAAVVFLVMELNCAVQSPFNRRSDNRIKRAIARRLKASGSFQGNQFAREKFVYPEEMQYTEIAEELVKKTALSQVDATLASLIMQIRGSPRDSEQMKNVVKRWNELISLNKHVIQSVDVIGVALLGPEKGPYVLKEQRTGATYYYPWKCIQLMVDIFESQCGPMSLFYGYSTPFANLCDAGVDEAQMTRAAKQICS